MQPISIADLEILTPVELGVVLAICHRTLTKAQAFGSEWRAAHATLENVLRLRRSQITPYKPGSMPPAAAA